MKPSLRAGEQHVAARLVDRRARRLHARHRQVEFVERLVACRRSKSSIDRPATPVSMHSRHALRDARRARRAKPLSKSALTGMSVAADDLAHMRQHRRRADCAPSATPARIGKAGAGGRQRLEAETLQIARAADVPRIGNDEAAGLVQLAEGAAFLGWCSAWRVLVVRCSSGVNPIYIRKRSVYAPGTATIQRKVGVGIIALEGGPPCRRSKIKPAIVANSCNFSPRARCGPPAASRLSRAKDRRPAPSCPTR